MSQVTITVQPSQFRFIMAGPGKTKGARGIHGRQVSRGSDVQLSPVAGGVPVAREAAPVYAVHVPVEKGLERREEMFDVVVRASKEAPPVDAELQLIRIPAASAAPEPGSPPPEWLPEHLASLFDDAGHITGAVVDSLSVLRRLYAQARSMGWSVTAPAEQVGRPAPAPEEVCFDLVIELRQGRRALAGAPVLRVLQPRRAPLSDDAAARRRWSGGWNDDVEVIHRSTGRAAASRRTGRGCILEGARAVGIPWTRWKAGCGLAMSNPEVR